MSKYLTVVINDQPVFEYDREINLEDGQLEFLDKMDSDMNHGIKMSGELFEHPDMEHRTKFVVMNLIRALQQEDTTKISALCAYLTHRRPDVIEVRANDQGGSVVIDLVNED